MPCAFHKEFPCTDISSHNYHKMLSNCTCFCHLQSQATYFRSNNISHNVSANLEECQFPPKTHSFFLITHLGKQYIILACCHTRKGGRSGSTSSYSLPRVSSTSIIIPSPCVLGYCLGMEIKGLFAGIKVIQFVLYKEF